MNFNRNEENWNKFAGVLGIHPRSNEATIGKALWGFLIGVHEAIEAGLVEADVEVVEVVEPDNNDADCADDEQGEGEEEAERQRLMVLVEEKTGVKPHHMTGIKKLRRRLDGLR